MRKSAIALLVVLGILGVAGVASADRGGSVEFNSIRTTVSR